MISSCEQFARIASWRMNRLKSSLISFSLIVIVSIFLLPWRDSNPRPPQEWDALTILASRHTVYFQLRPDRATQSANIRADVRALDK